MDKQKTLIKKLILKNLNFTSKKLKQFIYKSNINFIESGLDLNNYIKKPFK